MSKKASLPIHDGTKVSDAVDIYKAIIHRNGLSKHTIKEWGPDLVLPNLTDPDGWLATWMLKSDEMAIELLGSRIWNCAYMADKNSVEGVRPINMSEIESESEVSGYDSYQQYDIAESVGVPIGIRYLICNAAFLQTLEVQGREVSIKPIQGLYDLERPLQHGDLLPLPNPVKVSAQHWNSLLVRINKSKIYDFAKENSPTTSLE